MQLSYSRYNIIVCIIANTAHALFKAFCIGNFNQFLGKITIYKCVITYIDYSCLQMVSYSHISTNFELASPMNVNNIFNSLQNQFRGSNVIYSVK